MTIIIVSGQRGQAPYGASPRDGSTGLTFA